MPTSPDPLIVAIHAAPTRVVIAVTGGGSQAISRLLEVGGASRTMLEAVVPYSSPALDDFLRAKPEQYCSPHTARAMAMAAFERARRLTGDATDLAGIGCTASLASDRPKRGAHRAYVAVQTPAFTQTWSLTLDSTKRSRTEEERIVGEVVLEAVAAASGLSEVTSRVAALLASNESLKTVRTVAPQHWTELLLGRQTCASGHRDINFETALTNAKKAQLVFPGAFNPRHDGHRHMAAIAARRTGSEIAHEISIANVDKPPLDFIDLAERAAQFAATEPLWITRAATFREKADIFPGTTFVVGVDTIERIAEPRYYGDSVSARDAAIAHLLERHCRFLVFGRTNGEQFKSLSDIPLLPALAQLCDEVPAAEFREDVSSTELRRNA
jgi:nicotinamide mononucleotide (NMN) deamidase PncC